MIEALLKEGTAEIHLGDCKMRWDGRKDSNDGEWSVYQGKKNIMLYKGDQETAIKVLTKMGGLG